MALKHKLPSKTQAEIDTIVSPEPGEVVYNSDTQTAQMYAGWGSWEDISAYPYTIENIELGYLFDDGVGGTVTDRQGKGINITNFETYNSITPTWTTDGLEFGYGGGGIWEPIPPINSYPITIESVMRWRTLADDDYAVFALMDTTIDDVAIQITGLRGNPLKIDSAIRQNSYTNWSSSLTPVLDTWYHFTWIFGASNDRRLYVNGVLDSSDTTNVTWFNPTDHNLHEINIGVLRDSTPTYGSQHFEMALFRVWTRKFTSSDIARNYSDAQRRMAERGISI